MSASLDKQTRSATFWPTGLWMLVSAILLGFFGWILFGSDNKALLLVGEASHGHYQIEMSCDTCHTTPFGGKDALQKACENCHGEALSEANDSHPKKKFTDPRNADRLEVLDARYCVTCHQEHQKEYTDSMGVTLPTDFCVGCHAEVGAERASHKDMTFDTCASAGCHNYHDNRALYEEFLVKHAHPQTFTGQQPERNAVQRYLEKLAAQSNPTAPLTKSDADAPPKAKHAPIADAWANSNHAMAAVNCAGCHAPKADSAEHIDSHWRDTPDITVCKQCHEDEWQGFISGHHGMKLDARLTANQQALQAPLQVIEARLPMLSKASHNTLTCNSCHDPHQPDLVKAATESCLNCHADQHSLNFLASPHGKLWQQVTAGQRAAESAVSCATCHMPRINLGGGRIGVQHNQSDTLRPNEKMIRPVCMNCHSLETSIDALADQALIRRNFDSQPTGHISSIEMALKRVPPTSNSEAGGPTE